MAAIADLLVLDPAPMQVEPLDQFSRLVAQNDVFTRKKVPFGTMGDFV